MSFRIPILSLALALGAAPLLAAPGSDRPETAPAGTAATRYCMHVEAVTGSRIEPVVCWTRAEWADQGVDVDAEWAREGVRVIG